MTKPAYLLIVDSKARCWEKNLETERKELIRSSRKCINEKPDKLCTSEIITNVMKLWRMGDATRTGKMGNAYKIFCFEKFEGIIPL
jgi:hypothetical protein